MSRTRSRTPTKQETPLSNEDEVNSIIAAITATEPEAAEPPAPASRQPVSRTASRPKTTSRPVSRPASKAATVAAQTAAFAEEDEAPVAATRRTASRVTRRAPTMQNGFEPEMGVTAPPSGTPAKVIADPTPAPRSRVTRPSHAAQIMLPESAGNGSPKKSQAMSVPERQVRQHLTSKLGYTINLEFAVDGKTLAMLAMSPLGQRVIIKFKKGTWIPAEEPMVAVGATTEHFVPDGIKENYRAVLETADTSYGFLADMGLCFVSKRGTKERCWAFSSTTALPEEIDPGMNGVFPVAVVRYDQLRDARLDEDTIFDRISRTEDTPDYEVLPSELGTFYILTGLLRHTGLDEVLRAGTFTLLAPNDDAFRKIDAGTLRSLMDNKNRNKLFNILLTHVYEGEQDIDQVGGSETMQGGSITWNKLNEDKILAGRANVLGLNIRVKNGYIHVIDTVLMPKSIVDIPLSRTLPKSVDYENIDTTTSLLRVGASRHIETENEDLRDIVDDIQVQTRQLTGIVEQGAYREIGEELVDNTRRFRSLSKSPGRPSEAVRLGDEISVQNQQIDAALAAQQRAVSIRPQLQGIRERLDAILRELGEVMAAQAE